MQLNDFLFRMTRLLCSDLWSTALPLRHSSYTHLYSLSATVTHISDITKTHAMIEEDTYMHPTTDVNLSLGLDVDHI